MTQSIEEAVKALAEFEVELDRIKSEASEAKRRLVKTATEEAERAKRDVLARAQVAADEKVKAARREAERDGESITKKGEASMKQLTAAMSKRKSAAVELAARRLLGS